MAGLSVVIPTLEEASRLPLLLADLQQWPGDLEVIVSDAGSSSPARLCPGGMILITGAI